MIFRGNRLCCSLVAALASVWTVGFVTAAEPIELKPKFPPGHVSYVEIVTDIDQVIHSPQMPGGKMEQKIYQLFGAIEKVDSSTKDGAKLALTHDRIVMRMDVPMMGNMTFDSDIRTEKESQYLEQLFGTMVGMPLTMEMENNGQAKSFSGMTAVLEKVKANAPANPFVQFMGEVLTDGVAKQTWGDSRYAGLPEKKVSVGDTWTQQLHQTVPRLGDVVIDYKCKFDKMDKVDGKDVAIISYQATMTNAGKDAESAKSDKSGEKSGEKDSKATTQPEGPPKPKIENSKIDGVMTFDIKGGQVIKRTQDIEMKLTMKMPGSDDAPPMTVEAKRKETTTERSQAERDREKKENLAKAAKLKEEAAKNPDKDDADDDDDSE